MNSTAHEPPLVTIIGGGAAGFFGALACAESAPGVRVRILERSNRFLAKVRISGGGRCNVTHSCFEPRTLVQNYPRGGRALIGPFHHFQPRDTIEWFRARGVELKREADGRMFPTTDTSETIIDCFLREAARLGIEQRTEEAVTSLAPCEGGWFLQTTGGEYHAHKVLVATGGPREGVSLVAPVGHSTLPPVPSLFTFRIESPWLHDLAGVSLKQATIRAEGTRLASTGPLLITHRGLSGPAVLKLSAWGARDFHEAGYRFPIQVDWSPGRTASHWEQEFERARRDHPTRRIAADPLHLPSRLWAALVAQAEIPEETQWTRLPRKNADRLVRLLHATPFEVSGRDMNKEEFVTCGGVPLPEVDLRTMESKIAPGLYFAGEALDIDAVTGGFNFQAAWTTGWIAGKSIAASLRPLPGC